MDDPTTGYELTFEERPGYLYVRIQASAITEEIAKNYLREIAARCVETGCERLMLYRDIPEMLADAPLFFISADFQQQIRGTKTAFVNPYAANEDSFDFAVRVSTNRGADYAVFNTTSAAEKWLLQGVTES
jgi:hypothetical protein